MRPPLVAEALPTGVETASQSSAPMEAKPESEPAPRPQLSEEEIIRLVDQEMGTPSAATDTESNSVLMAFGVTLVAFVYVGILLLGRVQPAVAARPSIGAAAPVAVAQVTTPRWINWTYSLEEGQARARQNRSKVFIGFYTDWCPACKWVDSAVYTRPDVLAESQNVAMVKINAEGRRDLSRRYNITVYPSFIWTDENGNITARQDGSTSASEFASLMARNR